MDLKSLECHWETWYIGRALGGKLENRILTSVPGDESLSPSLMYEFNDSIMILLINFHSLLHFSYIFLLLNKGKWKYEL